MHAHGQEQCKHRIHACRLHGGDKMLTLFAQHSAGRVQTSIQGAHTKHQIILNISARQKQSSLTFGFCRKNQFGINLSNCLLTTSRLPKEYKHEAVLWLVGILARIAPGSLREGTGTAAAEAGPRSFPNTHRCYCVRAALGSWENRELSRPLFLN